MPEGEDPKVPAGGHGGGGGGIPRLPDSFPRILMGALVLGPGGPAAGEGGGGGPGIPLAPRKPRWELRCVPDGLSGRGDFAVGEQEKLLKDGWEPFAATGRVLWFRRLKDV